MKLDKFSIIAIIALCCWLFIRISFLVRQVYRSVPTVAAKSTVSMPVAARFSGQPTELGRANEGAIVEDTESGSIWKYQNGAWVERKPITNIVMWQDVYLKAIANSYFRAGQQATLVAISRHQRKEREVRKRYGDIAQQWMGHYTNRDDFEVVTTPIDMMDDPRIFEALRLLNNGSVLGLDTNSWAGLFSAYTNRPAKVWTVLKE